MSLSFWRLIALVGVAIFVLSALIMMIFRFRKIVFYKKIVKDELVYKRNGVNSKNFIYFTKGETAKFIKKYVIMKSGGDKYLVCQFNRSYQKIAFTVIQCKKRGKPISVLKCVELGTGESSRIIPLKKRCNFVNVVVNKVDTNEINTSVIKPLPRKKINAFCFFKFFLTFGLLIAFRHLLVEFICGETFTRAFFNGALNYALIAISFILALVNSVTYKIALRRKSRIARRKARGGVLEYEFI